MVGVMKSWSVTAASNASADSNINWAEGQSPPSLNNSARAEMAAIKAWANQITAAKTTGGSSNAYTFTSDAAGAISTSYAAGMAFMFKANHTNSGAATLNVDGVGAKAIKKGGAQAALVANDIVSGGIYLVAYEASGDCFLLLNYEMLDPTLTALAALSWSSGSPVVQFTAADTVSLTLTPSVSSVTASGAGVAGTFVNTTDNGTVQALRIEGDRATPAANDAVYASFYLSDSAGNQDEMARVLAQATTVTNGAEETRIIFVTRATGTLANRAQVSSTLIGPTTNDGIALGAAATAFSDAYFATGAVLGFGNGNYTLTHSSGILTASGEIVLGNVSPSSIYSAGFLGVPNSRVITASATLAMTDAGRHISVAMSSGSQTVTIPPNSSVAFPVGTFVRLRVPSGNTFTVVEGFGVTLSRADGTSGTGTRTVASSSTIDLWKVDTNAWEIFGAYT